MSESWIAVLVFISTSLLIMSVGALAYDWLFGYRTAVLDRVKELSGEKSDERSKSLFKDIKRLRSDEIVEAQTWEEVLRRQLEQAGIACSVQTIVLCCLACGFLATTAGATWNWWTGCLLGAAGAATPLGVLRMRKNFRQRRLSRQLPEAFAMISRAVRAGQTIPSALQIIADDFDPPISSEFARCYEQQNLGISRESALRQLATRTGIMELQIFVVALLVQAKSGGDLVELLDNLSAMVRKRLKLKDRVRALTGEGRMQALVLTILPVAALVALIALAPDYAQCLLERPWLLAGTAAAVAAGAFWVRKIVNFDY
jgi:tight adherence protein B